MSGRWYSAHIFARGPMLYVGLTLLEPAIPYIQVMAAAFAFVMAFAVTDMIAQRYAAVSR